jgi:hypothetical protein
MYTKILDINPEGKSPLGRMFEMGLKEIRCEIVDLIHLTQYRDQWLALLDKPVNIRILFFGGTFCSKLS